jgi:hypothetical protein
MKDDLVNKATALKAFLEAMKTLRDEGILINKKDFTGQIGEWFVEMLYNGNRATSGIQKGWDVDVNGKHIQVKAHSKAETNKTSFSALDKESTERIDELIIVVFTFDYKLKAFYKVPWEIACQKIKLKGKKTPRNEITWNSIKDYKIDKVNLPRQEIVSLFI